MKMILVAMKDLAAENFGAPFAVPQEAVALRSFATEINRVDEKNPMNTHPQHFELYRIGTYDDAVGLVTPEMREGVPTPALLARGEEVKRTIQ